MRTERMLVVFTAVALVASGALAKDVKKEAKKEAPPVAAETPKPAAKDGDKPAAKDGDKAAAKVHFMAGKQFYKESRYEDAIREFRDAYKFDPNPQLLYNLAQAYEKAGDIAEALQNYRRYIHDSPHAEDRKTVEIAIGNLESRMAEKGVQLVTVYSAPDAAMVAIDGVVQGPTPLGANLKPGRHHLAVSLAGFKTLERDFGLTQGHALDIDVHLEAGAGVVTADPLGELPPLIPEVALNVPPPPPAPGASPANADAQKAATTPAPPPQPGLLERITPKTWGAFGVAVVAVAVGTGMQLSKSSIEAQAATENVQLKYLDLTHQAQSRVTASRVAFGLSAAGALAGGAFLGLDLGAF